MLSEVTPCILTFNEAANIGRTLSRLSWAREIVVVDSGSTDSTVDIVAEYPRARVVQRAFDCHSNQWNFAVHDAGVSSEWVLALDADYVLTDELVNEISRLHPPANVSGFVTPFRYCINGVPIRGAAYPSKVTLFRRSAARYTQDGHTQAIVVNGEIRRLGGYIEHDDRKPLRRWIAEQSRYMELEAEKLSTVPASHLAPMDRLRRTLILGPAAMFFYCAFVKANVLSGKAGLFYILQRTIAELLLSLHLLDRALRNTQSATAATQRKRN